jgi:hypothetical protein
MEYTIKRIHGIFKDTSERELKEMKRRLVNIIESLGGSVELKDHESLPLWLEVEFLHNIISFELESNPLFSAKNLDRM